MSSQKWNQEVVTSCGRIRVPTMYYSRYNLVVTQYRYRLASPGTGLICLDDGILSELGVTPLWNWISVLSCCVNLLWEEWLKWSRSLFFYHFRDTQSTGMMLTIQRSWEDWFWYLIPSSREYGFPCGMQLCIVNCSASDNCIIDVSRYCLDHLTVQFKILLHAPVAPHNLEQCNFARGVAPVALANCQDTHQEHD